MARLTPFTPLNPSTLYSAGILSRVLSQRTKLSLGLLLCAAICLPAQSQGLPAPLVRALQDVGIPPEAVALSIRSVELGSGKPAALEHQSRQIFAPASVMKLVTSQAALEMLGPSFQWITRVHATGPLQKGVLAGDLIIEGSGDPRLAQEDLWRLLRQLRGLGLREIQGDLVLDRSLFVAAVEDPASFDAQPERAYNALPDALLLDAKALQIRFIPNPETNTVTVVSAPALAGFNVQAPKLSKQPCDKPREQLQALMSGYELRFAGAYPLACGEKDLAFHVHSLTHQQYFDAAFRALWRELGGTLTGVTRAGQAGPNSRELLQWRSMPLTQALRDINKYSNNVMARNLWLSLAAQRGGPAANPELAAAKVMDWLSASGIDSRGVVFENGSGLSRKDRISAATLAEVLQRAWQQPTMPDFIASLPIAGLDGTMGRRAASPVRGRAYIKTGSLEGVASIAGYVTAKSGQRVVVVCLINHPRAAEARTGFDRLLDWVSESY